LTKEEREQMIEQRAMYESMVKQDEALFSYNQTILIVNINGLYRCANDIPFPISFQFCVSLKVIQFQILFGVVSLKTDVGR
jgi:hypothetical protein